MTKLTLERLNSMIEVKPIRKPADHERALKQMKKLWGAKPGTSEADTLDVLATLIDQYEAKQFPIGTPDPIDAIKFRMEQQGLTRKDLEGIIGSRGRIAEVLSGKRELSLSMIRRLHEELDIPADVLIGGAPKVAA
jgi:HTH-type transcriptional regulator / antitoxin HigA